jgi:hypothetical protein
MLVWIDDLLVLERISRNVEEVTFNADCGKELTFVPKLTSAENLKLILSALNCMRGTVADYA